MSHTVFGREKESNLPDLFDNARNTPAKEYEIKNSNGSQKIY